MGRIILGVATLIVAVLILGGCGGGGDQSSAIASKIGASSCSEEEYGIESRVDGSKQRLYNCTLHGKTVCVMNENGIAKDVTALARIVYANALGGQKPACING